MESTPNHKAMAISEVNWDDEGSVVAFVMGRWERRDQYRGQLEKQWYTNIAQYMGYQYNVYDPRSGKMVVPDAPPWRVRLVANRLLPIARKVVSKLLRQRPTWTALPATNEAEDAAISRVATKALAAYWRTLDMDRVLVDAFTWMCTTGNSFLRVYWDPKKGEALDLSSEVQDMPKSVQKLAAAARLGDAAVDCVSPFELDIDPNCTKLQEATHVIHSKVRDVKYLENAYGVKGIRADATDDTVMARYFERRLATMGGPSGFMGMRNTDEDSNSAMTHTLWMNPCTDYPEGAYAIIAGGKVLHLEKSLPNPFKRIPYVHLIEIPVPGRLWGTCAIEQCLPLQADYNRGRSQLCEARNQMTKPKWLLPRGSGVLSTALTDEPGEIVEYNFGAKPEMQTPAALPDYIHRILEYDLKDMEDVSAIHEVTNARAPSGVRSGVAIAQLQEMDDQMLAPCFLMAEKELSRVGGWLLEILAKNIQEDRLIRIVGQDKQVEAVQFTGKSLFGPSAGRPGVSYFDVEMQMGSQLPSTKPARLQFALDLVAAGILDRVADRKQIFKILDLGTEEPVLNDESLDRQQAQRENAILLQGMVMDINPWDDDEVHMDTLRRFQKQPDYAKASANDPMANSRFEQHFAQHYMRAYPQMMGGALPLGDPAMQAEQGGPGIEEGQPPGLPQEQLPQEQVQM
jgi:hypothetical protein